MPHRAAMFSGLPRQITGMALSAFAVLVLLAYVVLPSDTGVSWAAVYTQSAAKSKVTKVKGTFTKDGKKPLKGQVVTIRFRNAAGRVIKTVKVKLDGRGRFSVAAPAGARAATISAVRGGSKLGKTFTIKPGKTLSITASLPSKSSGLLPAIFPY